MHPAYSVILFTTASGAGYGLLIWLSLGALLGLLWPEPWLGVVGLGLALALIAGGLLSSTFHLGRPERAWRAFSEWRTSWLSREGVVAVATFVPVGIMALAWVFGGRLIWPAAIASIVGAVATVWCTGMIYASLPTIRAWNNPLVTPGYIVLSLATGGVLLAVILALFSRVEAWVIWVAVVPLAAGWVVKALYWSEIDDAPRTLTAGAATGLGRFGRVRPLDPPHTQPNYVMREMGYQVARKHSEKLRRLVIIALFAVPIAALLAMIVAPHALDAVLALIAVGSAAVGVGTERWLFFAEAEHVSMLYYGRDIA
ncbi:MAG: DmsC/YnfH family molybdoenzyme membrane anchor subunit [Hyphomicrobiaceae bacterium]